MWKKDLRNDIGVPSPPFLLFKNRKFTNIKEDSFSRFKRKEEVATRGPLLKVMLALLWANLKLDKRQRILLFDS